MLALVNPHPRLSERPRSIVGIPGIVAPTTAPEARSRRAKYHCDGAVRAV